MEVMKAGRDLDIAVAFTVMEYFWVTHWLRFSAELEAKWIGTAQEVEAAGGVYVKVKEEDVHRLKLRECHDENVPCFSTKLEAAQEVIKRMEQQGYTYQQLGDTGAAFAKGTQMGKMEKGESLPAAICAAAILAVRSV